MILKIFIIIEMCYGIVKMATPTRDVGEVLYSGEIFNVSFCPEFNGYKKLEVKLNSFEWLNGKYLQRIYGALTLNETFKANYVKVTIHRCQGYHFACENFQSWTMSAFVLCSMSKLKNQFWSDYADKFLPQTWRKSCPYAPPDTYYLDGVVIDPDAAIKFYSEAAKYIWIANISIYNSNDKMIFCGTGEGKGIKHTFRRRVRKNKDKSKF